MTTANDMLYNYGVRPVLNLGAYVTGIGGEGLNTFDKIDTDQAMIDSYSGTVRDDEGNIISTNTREDPDADPDADSDDADTDKDDKGGTGGKGDLSESDLKTVYADLLPMFKETLGVDDEDFKKDAYLQLARFGTNLMAQPGGSLTAAEGLTGSQAYKQFMSPYQQDVIDATLQDFDRQAAMQRQNIGQSAMSSGAFGGARQGVAEAEYDAASDRNRSSILSGLLQTGFGQAQQAAQQAFSNQGALAQAQQGLGQFLPCLLYTSPSPRDRQKSRMPSSA